MKLFLQKDCLDETHLAAELFAKRQNSPKYTTPENAQYIYNEFVLVDDETPADPTNPASEGPPTNLPHPPDGPDDQSPALPPKQALVHRRYPLRDRKQVQYYGDPVPY